MVCNYGPAGNFIGSPVYEQGEAGSNCPSGTKKTRKPKNQKGLCAWNENENKLLRDTPI